LQSPEERVRIAKYARSCVKADPSETVRKQWDTIKSNPELYEKNRSRLERQSVEGWKNADEATRNKRILSFINRNKSRSAGSDKLKRLMIERGLYEGFVSEEIFHGFIPDEINHGLKIIVEYYGDVYHCRPRRYKDPSQYLKFIGRTVGEQWARDKKRLAVFYRFGYVVVIVWESDFKRDEEGQLRRIQNEIDRKRSVGGIV
jgi:G:T-mismatch repair DNA endonuclease (very short patch repair protein)